MGLYKVWCPDYGQTEDDARSLVTFSENSAAIQWAEEYDKWSAEYSIAGGEVVSVAVKAPEGAVTTLVVYGEAVPQYRAREVRP